MPAGRSRQPRANTRECGHQPAHQSLLNRRLSGSASYAAQCSTSLHLARAGIGQLRSASLTPNIRVVLLAALAAVLTRHADRVPALLKNGLPPADSQGGGPSTRAPAP